MSTDNIHKTSSLIQILGRRQNAGTSDFLINKHTFAINALPEFAEGFVKSKRVSIKLHYLA